MKTISNAKVELTVRRPDDNIEIVLAKQDYMTDDLFAKIKSATAAAGRGDVLSYKVIPAVIEMEDNDYIERCERCGQQVDSRTAYHQIERGWFGGREIKVKAYYCKDCHQVLSAVGAGEQTALEDRATEAPDNTPELEKKLRVDQ